MPLKELYSRSDLIPDTHPHDAEPTSYLLWQNDEIVTKGDKKYRVKAKLGPIKLLEPMVPTLPLWEKLINWWAKVRKGKR